MARPSRSGGALLGRPLRATLAALGLAGCHAIAGLEGDYVRGQSSSSTGGGETGGGGAGGAPMVCTPASPPVAPTADDGAMDVSFTVALRSIDLREDAGIAVGYDLDGRCTCDGSGLPTPAFPSSCQLPTQADPAGICDAPGGIDGQSAQIFAQFAAGGFDSARMSGGIDDGYWSVLIAVDGYDGGQNDTQISVRVYNAAPLGSVPVWDGTDAWPLDPGSLVDGMSADQPVYQTENAYVSGGILVMSLDAGALVFSDGMASHLRIELTGAILTGKVTQGPNGYGLTEGVLSGKWAASDIFDALDDFRTSGAPICTTDFAFSFLRTRLCERLDINSGAPNVAEPCDAISFGIGFEAEPATLGAVGTMPAPLPGCSPSTLPSSMPCP